MSGSLGGLLAAQVVFLAIGGALLPLLRIAPTRAAVVPRLGLAYMVGVAAVGILAAHLALLDVPLGLLELALLAVVLLVLAVRRVRRSRPGRAQRLRRDAVGLASLAVGVAAGGALCVLLVHAARAFAVRPLKEWDGWAIWATKARALYEFGGAYEPVFTTYQPVAHPLLLPSVEAIDFRAMGAFDGTLVHLQLALLAVGFAAALWGLLGDRVPAALLGPALLATLAAAPVLEQLSTNLADIPLAFFVALGVVALGRTTLTGEGWPLVCAALFLGAAMLTKSEGLLFALAAFAAAAAASGRASVLVRICLAALGALAILLPWRLFLALHDLRNPEYTLADLLDPGYLADHADRVGPAARELAEQLAAGRWALIVPLALTGIASALLAGRYRLALFAVLWPGLAFVGLVGIYWISVVPVELTLTWTAERVVTSLVLASAALAPLLVAEAWPFALDALEGRTRRGSPSGEPGPI
jgi:hypothetical protein